MYFCFISSVILTSNIQNSFQNTVYTIHTLTIEAKCFLKFKNKEIGIFEKEIL